VCVCVCVALVIQLAVRMSRVTLPSVACLDIPYFSTLFHKLRDFWGKKLLNVKCFDILYNFRLKYFSF